MSGIRSPFRMPYICKKTKQICLTNITNTTYIMKKAA